MDKRAISSRKRIILVKNVIHVHSQISVWQRQKAETKAAKYIGNPYVRGIVSLARKQSWKRTLSDMISRLERIVKEVMKDVWGSETD